jgi:hypothetical protein
MLLAALGGGLNNGCTDVKEMADNNGRVTLSTINGCPAVPITMYDGINLHAGSENAGDGEHACALSWIENFPNTSFVPTENWGENPNGYNRFKLDPTHAWEIVSPSDFPKNDLSDVDFYRNVLRKPWVVTLGGEEAIDIRVVWDRELLGADVSIGDDRSFQSATKGFHLGNNFYVEGVREPIKGAVYTQGIECPYTPPTGPHGEWGHHNALISSYAIDLDWDGRVDQVLVDYQDRGYASATHVNNDFRSFDVGAANADFLVAGASIKPSNVTDWLQVRPDPGELAQSCERFKGFVDGLNLK